MALIRALASATALLVLTGCTVAARSTAPPPTTAASAAAPCIETTAIPAHERPPVLADTTLLWYGRANLWVAMADYPPKMDGSTMVLRFPWVTLEQRSPTPTPELGAPTVSARRTDAPGEAGGVVGEYTQTFGSGDLSFWPSSVGFPAAGCWTVSGRTGDTVVEFVVDVEAPR